MPFTEDVEDYLQSDELAHAATYSEGGATVNVIFTLAFVDAAGIESLGPVALGNLSDFPTVAHGQTLTIDSVVYTIVEVKPEGTGFIYLRLQG